MKPQDCLFFCFAFLFSRSVVPLIAQSVDLIGELGQILVGTALVVLDDPQQALAGADQTLEHRGGAVLALRYLVLDAYLSALLQADSTLGTDGPLRTVVGRAGGEALPGEGVDEDVFHLIFAVHHEHPLGLLGESVHPAQQSVPVCVAGHAGELADLRLHLNGLAEQLDRGGALDEGAAQSAHCLIAYEQDGALRPPQVVLEVMADAACLAHAAGRQDDLRRAVGVDHTGLVTGHGDPQPRHVDGVDALFQQGAGLLVEAVRVCVPEDAGGLGSQRAVDVDREVAVPFDQPFFLDLPQKIQHLLGATHRKTGHDHIAAPVKGALQDFSQLVHIIRARAVQPVAVGGLHEHIVRLADIGGVLDDGLVQIADIAGKHQLGGSVTLGDPQLDAGGAQQVAHIHEPHLDARSQLDALFVVHTHEQLHGRLGVLHGIHGLHRLGTGALGLAVLPLGLELLDVGGVPQHDTAQLHRGVGGVDFAPEAVAHQQRQHTGVVDVGVGDHHGVDVPGGKVQLLVVPLVPALLQAAVHQNLLAVDLQTMAAAGYALVSAVKTQLHGSVPFCFRREGQPSPRFVVPILPLF